MKTDWRRAERLAVEGGSCLEVVRREADEVDAADILAVSFIAILLWRALRAPLL